MRANLEDNQANGLRLSATRFSTIETSIHGPYIISAEGPHMIYLDTLGADQQVRLPPIDPHGGQLFVIGNIGIAGNIIIADSGGVTLFTVTPGSTNLCISSALRWHVSSFAPSAPGTVPVSTQGAVTANQLAGFSDSTGTLIRGVSVGSGLNLNTGVSPPLLTSTSATPAPPDAEYLVALSNVSLTNERLVGPTTSIVWDFSTPGTAIAKRAALTGDVTAAIDDNTLTIANGAVTNAKMSDLTAPAISGRITAGTGPRESLTPTQVTSMLDLFTSSLKGLTPSSGGGTTNFLRADGTWAAPPGGGGGASLTIQDTAPTPTNGSLWWESDTGKLFVGYNDGNTAQWVGVQAAAPVAQDRVLLATLNPTTTFVIGPSILTSAYDSYEFEFQIYNASGAVTPFAARISTDGGATFIAGSGYYWAFSYAASNAAGGPSGGAAQSYMAFGIGPDTGSVVAQSGIIKVFKPWEVGTCKTFNFQTSAFQSFLYQSVGTCGEMTNSNPINAIQFFWASGGAMSNKSWMKVYGVK